MERRHDPRAHDDLHDRGLAFDLARTSLDGDMVFSDGYDDQLATVTGSVRGGLTAGLPIGV